MELLLEAVFRRYGYDFREYAPASMARRIGNAVQEEGLTTISGLQEKLLHDPECLERFLLALTINVTSMFRDPEFFRAMRAIVVPQLRTYPFIRIWHAGCSTGEEVYSMAILLHEEELYDRCRIYATDINEAVLRRAGEGIFPLASMKEYARNHLKAGGTLPLSEYYTAAYDHAIFRASLRENIVFSQHNLATDRSINEFHLIVCRNVLIYFTKPLHDRVHRLFYESLVHLGYLGLGSKEAIQFTPHDEAYEVVDRRSKIYRRIS
jgi:chemotaxis protein methyltransferase CheR